MKHPHHTSFQELLQMINDQYQIGATHLTFIPVGDKSYSYQVQCSKGERYYLKLLDNNQHREEITQTDYYLPLLQEFQHKKLLPYVISPLLNKHNNSKTNFKYGIHILFPWVEGDTLANAYPLSTEHVRSIARLAASLHQISPFVTTVLPIEKFDCTFLDDLLMNIDSIQSVKLSGVELALKEVIEPRRHEIVTLIEQMRRIQSRLTKQSFDLVICHGDLWGGNLIHTNNQYIMIDWESVIFAPFEREFAAYITQKPFVFFEAYTEAIGKQIVPNIDLLRYYCFISQLGNLHHWIDNIASPLLSERQKIHDLDLIENHCLNRWQGIEEGLQLVDKTLRT